MSKGTDKIAPLLKLIATNIVFFRKKKGLTQDDLAAMANMDRTYIGYIENAKQNITLSKLSDIADALGIKLETLFIPNEEELDTQTDIDRLNISFPFIREFQKLANKHYISDVFQDNGGKLLQVLLVTGLINIKEREGNDAKDKFGNEYELKSVNLSLTNQFSTHHHLNPKILTKYRLVKWVFAVYEGIELKEIYLVNPDSLEKYFKTWEKTWNRKKLHSNNPKIPLKHVKSVGKLIYTASSDGKLYSIEF